MKKQLKSGKITSLETGTKIAIDLNFRETFGFQEELG